MWPLLAWGGGVSIGGVPQDSGERASIWCGTLFGGKDSTCWPQVYHSRTHYPSWELCSIYACPPSGIVHRELKKVSHGVFFIDKEESKVVLFHIFSAFGSKNSKRCLSSKNPPKKGQKIFGAFGRMSMFSPAPLVPGQILVVCPPPPGPGFGQRRFTPQAKFTSTGLIVSHMETPQVIPFKQKPPNHCIPET